MKVEKWKFQSKEIIFIGTDKNGPQKPKTSYIIKSFRQTDLWSFAKIIKYIIFMGISELKEVIPTI